MNDIAIYGAGGFGREIACLIKRINEVNPQWNLIGFFDDDENLNGKQISHFGVCLGGINVLNEYPAKLAVVMAIGNSLVTKKICDKIMNPNIEYPNLIHPNFVVCDEETFVIGKGNIIQGGCVATVDVHIGDFNVFNGAICMGHDVYIGNYNTFMPAVRISGDVIVGDNNFFGVGSIVLQQLKVGNNVRLGAGGVLMTKPKNGFLYIGNPAKKTEL